MATAHLNKPVLSIGSTGAAVFEVQQLLNANTLNLNIQLEVDGIFGQKTQNAIERFQNQVFQSVDGIVNDQTWRALYKSAPVDMPTLKQGSTGHLVLRVQQTLTVGNYYHGLYDGEYGSMTEKAVAAFQHAQGATASGIVDNETWYRLSKFLHPPFEM